MCYGIDTIDKTDKIITPAELFLKAVDKEVIKEYIDKLEEKRPRFGVCSICGRSTEVYKGVFSDRYGEFSVLKVNINEACYSCFLAVKYGGDTRLKIRNETQGIIYYYSNEKERGEIKLYSKGQNEKDENKLRSSKEFLKVMLKPPVGYFMIAFNRNLYGDGKGSHYIPFGVVNYNPGECDEYYVTFYDTVIKIDRIFLEKYIEAVKKTDEYVYYRNINNKRLCEKFNKEGISRKDLLKNVKALSIINRVIKISSANEKKKDDKRKEKRKNTTGGSLQKKENEQQLVMF